MLCRDSHPSAGSGSVALDKLVEPAGAAACLILVQERQPIVFENLEEFVPVDLLEGFLRLPEVDPQDSAGLLGSDDGRMAIPFLGPFPDLVGVGGGGRLAHPVASLLLKISEPPARRPVPVGSELPTTQKRSALESRARKRQESSAAAQRPVLLRHSSYLRWFSSFVQG